MIRSVIPCMCLFGSFLATAADPSHSFSVREFGALGDGLTMDTAAVQKAVNTCADGGGGTVFFPAGTYLCGSLHLRSNLTLWLDNGARILGSPDDEDYDPYEALGFENDADHETSYFHFALLWGEEVEHVAIMGQGVIDGNRTKRFGPKPIALKRCRDVTIRGITIVNSPNYCISMLGTDDVVIDGVTIRDSHCDGIDPDSCRNVRISNCHIETWDDAIVPKASFSLGERRSTENITVTNCYLSTVCNAFKLGTESGGDFKRIAVSNCVMSGLKGKGPAISGIALESVDGANIDGVVISNVTMIDCRAPIFVRLGNRGRDMETPVPGTLRNVSIDNVVATRASLHCSIAGIPEHPVENVSISNVQMEFVGGAPYQAVDLPIPEVESNYPEAEMFGPTAIYGLFARHVAGLRLLNVRMQYVPEYWRVDETNGRKITWDDTMTPSPSSPGKTGHALWLDDVRGLRMQLVEADAPNDGSAVIRLANVRDAVIANGVAAAGTAAYLELAGVGNGGVRLVGCDVTGAGDVVRVSGGADAGIVVMEGCVEQQ